MIVCDADNITGTLPRPSPEAIREETRRQLEALKELRRRVSDTAGRRPVGVVQPSA